MRYSCILFDLDGTLVYSHPGIFHCLKIALNAQGITDVSEQKLRECIGPPLRFSLTRIWGLTDEQAQSAERVYRAEYDKIGWEKCALIDGAKECLEALKKAGYTLALATSKPLLFAERILQHFGLKDMFSVRMGSGLDGSFPDKKSVIEECVKRLGVKKNCCLMVGDRMHDVEGAKLAGVDCVALNVGYAQEGEFEREIPTYLLDNFTLLRAFLMGESVF